MSVKTFLGVSEARYVCGTWAKQDLTTPVEVQVKGWLKESKVLLQGASTYKTKIVFPDTNRMLILTVWVGVYFEKEEAWCERFRTETKAAQMLLKEAVKDTE